MLNGRRTSIEGGEKQVLQSGDVLPPLPHQMLLDRNGRGRLYQYTKVGRSNRRMRTAIFVILFSAVAATQAQVAVPPAPWRGAGKPPCVLSDGGVYQCPPAPRLFAVRAGRLFDSKTGSMLTRQVVIVSGEQVH